MRDKKFDLEDRLVDFAADSILFCKDLPRDMTGEYYDNQLLKTKHKQIVQVNYLGASPRGIRRRTTLRFRGKPRSI